MSGPTVEFWESRFAAGDTAWDRGAPHPQLQHWLQAGVLPPGARVAVPGCGSGHEVAVLAAAGHDVTALDYAPAAIAATQARLAAQGLRAQLEQADVLQWQPATPLDAVYEQTCLCALHPDHWTRYAAQVHRWLRPGGRLLALVMRVQRPGEREGRIEGPAYHVGILALRALFPQPLWHWPAPPYPLTPHPNGQLEELGVVLDKR